jgi:hypothetical protein
MGYPNVGEADPGGLGACPQENPPIPTKIQVIRAVEAFFFQKKK